MIGIECAASKSPAMVWGELGTCHTAWQIQNRVRQATKHAANYSNQQQQRQLNSTRVATAAHVACCFCGCTAHKKVLLLLLLRVPTHKQQQQQTASNKLRLFCKTKLWLPFGCCFSFFFWFSNLNLKLNVLLSFSPLLSLFLSVPRTGTRSVR